LFLGRLTLVGSFDGAEAVKGTDEPVLENLATTTRNVAPP
jgi:hypothetical protein